MSHQPHILFFPSSVGKSHLNRLKLLRQALGEQMGNGIWAWANADEIPRGDQRVDVPDIQVNNFSENIFAHYTPEFIEKCVQAEVAIIQKYQPNLLIGDMRFSLTISAKITKTPYISLVNGYLTDYFNPVGAILTNDKPSLRFKAVNWLGKRLQNRQKLNLAKPFRKVARRFGLKDLNSLYDFLRGDLTLVADIPEFCPLESLPEAVKYIGPLIWEGGKIDELPDFFQKLSSEDQLIYVTLGNTGKVNLVKWVYEAFAEREGYKIVITTGAFVHLNADQFPDHFLVRQFLPGTAVLKHAAFCIHCGGNGTTYQVLREGIPALVVPFNTDQLINAHLVKKHQVGVAISPTGMNSDQLLQAMKKLEENTVYRKNVLRFKSLFTNWNGPQRAATEIVDFHKTNNKKLTIYENS